MGGPSPESTRQQGKQETLLRGGCWLASIPPTVETRCHPQDKWERPQDPKIVHRRLCFRRGHHWSSGSVRTTSVYSAFARVKRRFFDRRYWFLFTFEVSISFYYFQSGHTGEYAECWPSQLTHFGPLSQTPSNILFTRLLGKSFQLCDLCPIR